MQKYYIICKPARFRQINHNSKIKQVKVSTLENFTKNILNKCTPSF